MKDKIIKEALDWYQKNEDESEVNIEDFVDISSANFFGILPISAWAFARAASTSSRYWSLRFSPKISINSFRPYR